MLLKENQSKKEFSKEGSIKIKEFTEEDKVVKEKEIVKVETNIPKIAYTIKLPIKDIKNIQKKITFIFIYLIYYSL